jgi:hypothetical protein
MNHHLIPKFQKMILNVHDSIQIDTSAYNVHYRSNE